MKTFDFFANVDKKDKNAFNDALPIGNGSMGAMIYGSPIEEKIILNEDSLWLGKKYRKRENSDFKKYLSQVKELINKKKTKEAEELLKLIAFSSPKGECIYSVAGELHLFFNHENYTNYQRSIDLDKACIYVEYDNLDNHIKRTYFASYPDQVIAIKIESTKMICFTGYLDREKLLDEIRQVSINEIELTYLYNNEDTLYIRLKVETDGKLAIIGTNIVVEEATNTNIYLTLRTTFYNKNASAYCEEKLKCISYDLLLKSHIADYQKLYNRQTLNTTDEMINYLYNFSRYLMISASRQHSQPANLQGIWCQDIFPAWDSKYTININLQMNYWNVFRANLCECSLPFFDLLERIYKQGKRLAKNMYGVDGFVAFHNADIYGDCAPQDKYLPATYWPFGGAWLSLAIYEYYEYTHDTSFLQKYYHIVHDACQFFKNILEENDDQELVVSPSLSPENSYYYADSIVHIAKGCTMDSQILTDLFTELIKINNILEMNLEENKIYQNILKKLPKIKLTKDGRVREWDEDYLEVELGHRHISHLYGLYPSHQISQDNLKIWDAAKKTLECRIASGGGHTGWSKAWITCMWARLNEGNRAYNSFKEFILNSTSRVGLDLHPPFQIDGNFGIAAAISEMFVREENNKLYLLPALPDSGLEKGAFLGIRLKNNIILDIKWSNNSIIYLQFTNNSNKEINLNLICKKTNIVLPSEISITSESSLVFK